MSWVAANTRNKISASQSQSSGYVRPEDWLTMPTLTDTDQQISLLIAVTDDTTGLNKIAFTIAGNYTVDWGDGSTTENFTTGVKAEHEYAWADISSSTLTSDGYRQCICTITPQSGQDLTSFDLRVWPTTYPVLWRQPILFFVGAGASITSIGFSQSTTKTIAPLTLLKEIVIVKLGNITDFSYAWRRCSSLQSLTVDTSSGTNFYSAWYGCSSLQSLTVDTSSGTDFSATWYGCSSLQSLTVDTSSGTNFYIAWYGCSLLQSLTVDTSSGTDFSDAWNGCSSLQSLTVDTSSGTNFSYAWNGCSSLQSLTVDTSSGTDFSDAWKGCSSLQSLTVNNQLSSFNVNDCKLSTQALAELFASLASGVTSQTVTCSGCFGYGNLTSEQRAVATNKGWAIA